MEERTSNVRNYSFHRVYYDDCFIESLSDDCLIEIFKYLSIRQRLKIEKVCTRWRDLSKNNWYDVKKLNIRSSDLVKDLKKQSRVEQVLIRCGRYLNELSLSPICKSSIMPIVQEHCHNLTKLELELEDFCGKYFTGAFSNMKNLKCIKIMKTHGPNVIQCLQSLPKEIEEIYMENFRRRSYARLKRNSLVRFENLKYLALHAYAIRKNEMEVISKMKYLTKLKLDYCQINREDSLLISNLINLEYLYLRGIETIGNSLLIDISSKCKNLRFLNVNWCRRVNDHGVISILENLPSLDRLKTVNTSITYRSLVSAAIATQNRENNIILRFVVLTSLQKEFNLGKNPPRFLEVVGKY